MASANGGGGSLRQRVAPDSTPLRCVAPGRAAWEKLAGARTGSQTGGMNTLDNELQRHYGLLLGIPSPWPVKDVKLELAGKRVEIELVWAAGARAPCPVCGGACALYDYAPERTWRHLDTMPFQTGSRARGPRIECAPDGGKTVAVPWAAPRGRFTRLFERFAIDVLLCARRLTQAAHLLGLSWDGVDHIVRRAVERGLSRRGVATRPHLGMDEKSFGAGQSYLSLLTALKEGRVLEVVAERPQAAAEGLWDALPEKQRRSVEAVAGDMWAPFLKAPQARAPPAALVHDQCHVAAHLNEAGDRGRRAEHKARMAAGDEPLKGSRPLRLHNPRNFSAEQAAAFRALRESGLKGARAGAAKELFSRLWHSRDEGAARRFFREGYGWVSRSRLKPRIKVAKMLQRHLENSLTYLRHPIPNAMTEGLNSKIQLIKYNARGFRSFENFRNRILFFCGKLDLYPQ